jgi:hypothetical protein
METPLFLEHWINIDPERLARYDTMYQWSAPAETFYASRRDLRRTGCGRFRLRPRAYSSRGVPAREPVLVEIASSRLILAARPARRRNTRHQVLGRANCRFRSLATAGLARWQLGVPTTRSP